MHFRQISFPVVFHFNLNITKINSGKIRNSTKEEKKTCKCKRQQNAIAKSFKHHIWLALCISYTYTFGSSFTKNVNLSFFFLHISRTQLYCLKLKPRNMCARVKYNTLYIVRCSLNGYSLSPATVESMRKGNITCNDDKNTYVSVCVCECVSVSLLSCGCVHACTPAHK